MRKYIIVYLVLILNLFAGSSWQVVSIPNVCTFKIPDTMEVQAGTYKIISDRLQREILELPVDASRVIAQQKNLNSYTKQAFKEENYARIMVETDYEKKGDYENISTRLEATKLELKELSDLYKNEMINAFAKINSKGKIQQKLLVWYPLKIVNINGISMVKVSYKRSVNGRKPVLVNMYIVQNNDRLHRITIAHKINNTDYEDDLNKVIATFRFVRH